MRAEGIRQGDAARPPPERVHAVRKTKRTFVVGVDAGAYHGQNKIAERFGISAFYTFVPESARLRDSRWMDQDASDYAREGVYHLVLVDGSGKRDVSIHTDPKEFAGSWVQGELEGLDTVVTQLERAPHPIFVRNWEDAADLGRLLQAQGHRVESPARTTTQDLTVRRAPVNYTGKGDPADYRHRPPYMNHRGEINRFL